MIFKIKQLPLTLLVSLGVATVSGVIITIRYLTKRFTQKKKQNLLDRIGETPLIYLPCLSFASGSQIYCKAQHLNPFGSSKDRAVYRMIKQALWSGMLKEGGEVVQASSGSTAISLVHVCKIMNLKPYLYLPDDLAEDKYSYLNTLGANLVKVPPVSIVDPNHFFKLAQSSSSSNKHFFLNQFQNLNNLKVHYEETGPQIYVQTHGKINAFVCSAGTGGTIAGISKYLKQKNNDIKIILADPQGSGLYNKVKYDVLFTKQEKEGYRLKNPFDTVIEGVGLNRQTNNFSQAIIDDSYKVSDVEALHMAYYLIQNQGLFVGSSSALNLAAVVKYARENKDKVIVTVTHDSGNRYMKKFYNQQYLRQKRIPFEKRSSYPKGDLSFIL